MMDSLEKINSSIQYALSYIIREEFPDQIISLTDVRTTPDLEYCDILISVLNDDSEIVDKLNRSAKTLRKKMADSLNLRRTPMLRFSLDTSDANYQKIDKLLNGQS